MVNIPNNDNIQHDTNIIPIIISKSHKKIIPITDLNIPNVPKILKPPNTKDIINISKYIDNIITLLPKQHVLHSKRDALSFYNYLIVAQSYLGVDELKPQVKYFLELDTDSRVNILKNFENMTLLNTVNKPIIFKILESSLSYFHKNMVLYKLQNLDTMQTSDSEYYKLSQWIDNILDIPFNIYKQPLYITHNSSKIFHDARAHLDSVIYGQQQTKQHILEIIAKMISNPQAHGSVFAVEGEPGTGKTTLIKNGLSFVLGLPFVFISLGGAQDASYLTGENYSYVGSKCGKIIQALKEVKCMNPIFYFDELDKVSNTDKGREIINLLIHLTDYSQNQHFLDYYMDGITIDLSRATFIFSFNDRDKVCPILLDRMDIIKFKSYCKEEKTHIIEHYLLPSIAQQYFNNKYVIKFMDDNHKHNILNNIINSNTNINKLTSQIQWSLFADMSNNTHIILQTTSENNNISIRNTPEQKIKKKLNLKSKYIKHMDNINTNTNTKINTNYISNHIKNIRQKQKRIHKKYIQKLKQKHKTQMQQNTNKNSGVRYIIRNIEHIISKINIEILENK